MKLGEGLQLDTKKILATVPNLLTPAESSVAMHVFHQFTVRVLGFERDELRRHLSEAGISSRVYSPDYLATGSRRTRIQQIKSPPGREGIGQKCSASP